MSRPINPWKDFASYKSSDARYFKGREESIAKFLRIVEADTMSVLYASSGIGKTSFLQAGVVPVMIERGYAPIHILFNDDDFAEGVDLSKVLKLHVEDEIKKYNENEDKIRKEKKRQNEDYITNKWGWNSLLDVQSEEIEQLIKGLDEKSLWWKFHTCEIRTESGLSLKPLLLLDQFEEVFVKAKAKNIQLQTFFDELEELASNNLPSEVETTLNQLANQGIFFDLDTHHHYKIIFSLRKEYLSDFDYWTNDRHSIAELQQNRMLLLPLSRNKAMKVIMEQPLNLDGSKCYTTLNNIAEEILNVIDDKKRNEIEPFILSVLCSRLYDRSVSLGKTELKPDDLNTYSANTIIREFYEQKMQSIVPKHSHITRIEEELIDEDGKRGRVKVKRLKDIEFEKRYKKDLEDAHLVRIDSYNGEDYIELVHDRVADAIMERRKESTNKNKLVVARIASFIAIIFLFFITYWIQTIPTSNNIFPYQLKYEDRNGNYVNFTGDSIHGENIVAINCHNLKTIVVDSCYSATIKVRGCYDLRNVFISESCGDVVLDLDNCPLLNPIQIPSSVYRLSFANIPPNDLSFHTEEKGRYVWKDNILWDKRDTTIIYARYDASINVTPPFNTGKNSFAYFLHKFNNEEQDTITLTGYDYKYNIKDSIRVPRNIEYLDLHAFNIRYPRNWDMSKFPNLREIILPDSLFEVSNSIFARCENLQHVTLPSALRRIGAKAFSGCLSLQEIVFPDSLNYIGKYAFEGCSSLVEIGLPDSIRVDISCFDGCLNLKKVRLPHYFRPECSRYPDFMFKKCPNISKFDIDKSSNHYSVENDSTIVYSGIKFNNGEIPLLFINTVNKHSYNSGEFSVADSIPPYSYFSRDGMLLYGNKNGSIVINDPKNGINMETLVINVSKGEERIDIPLTHNDVFLTGGLDDCTELHFPYTDESKRSIIELPAELKRNIRLYVPHGALSYFTGTEVFNASEWKSIDEESFFSWICIICKYHFNTGLKVVNQWGWFWPIIVILVLLVAALITYFYRRKEAGNQTSSSNVIRFIVNFTMTIVIGVFTWYTIYWFIFLTSYHLWGPTVLSEIMVDALISACLAILFVYVVLYSKGFNLKGFVDACKRNFYALWSGLGDAYFTMRNLSWQSVERSLQVMTKRVKTTIRNFRDWFMLGINRFRYKTVGLFQQKKHEFNAKPIRIKASIFLSFIVIIALLLMIFVNGRENNDKLRDEITKECKKLIEADTIEYKQIVALHDKLVETISISGMKTLYSSTEIIVTAMGDSIFIIVESDSCHYLNFSSMKYGNINFGSPIQKSKLGDFYLSDSKKFVYCNYNDSVNIWPINDLEEQPFKEKTNSSNSKCTWFAQDKYVCFEDSEGNYVVYNTDDWTCSTEVKKGSSSLDLIKISDGILVTKYIDADKRSEAFIYDENLKLYRYAFEGKYKGCFDNKYLVSQNNDTYMLYNLRDGLLLDKKYSNIQYEFYSEYSYAYKYNYSDSIFIFKAINKQIVFDVLPYRKEEISKKYVCYKNNDSIMIYHIPTNQIYNLGYSKNCSCSDSLVAINANDSITVYSFANSVNILGKIPYSSYSVYMRYSNNYLTFDYTKGLFRYNADSLWQTYNLTNDVYLCGWYCNNKNEYYSMEHYDDGSWLVNSEIKSDILRGGWCFMTSPKGYELNNIKSIKLLIKESQYIDNQIKEKLYNLIDKHYAKNQ